MHCYAKIQQALLLDLSQELRNDAGFISSDMSLAEIRAHALSASFYKKLSPSGTNNSADKEALKVFIDLNSSMSSNFVFKIESEFDSLLWDYFRDSFSKSLDFSSDNGDNFDLDFMRSTFNVGPGASIGANSESFYTKLFESNISATHPYLVALYRAAIVDTDFWAAAEKRSATKFGYSMVEGNRLFFVPKNSEISRTCCTEPSINMMFQKALGSFLEKRLARSFGINLSDQPDFNRELARIGSIDGSFGTIDLASASDSINWNLCEQIIPSHLLGWFRIFRSPSTVLPDGSRVPLMMVSTMGNGFTFPLETLIFASAVRAVYQLMGFPSSDPQNHFGVFGDDIVVRREAYDSVVTLLTKLGFKVNVSKSFCSGSFRESCGSDYYAGHSVRGVYIKSLETLSDRVSAANRLNRWSAVSGIPLPFTLLSLFVDTDEILKIPLVPFSESDDAGLKVPFDVTIPKVLDNYWFAYRKLVVKQKRRAVPIDELSASVLFYKDFNPYGWAVAFGLGYVGPTLSIIEANMVENPDGYDPVHYIVLRQDRLSKVFKCRSSSIPFWDYFPAQVTLLRRSRNLFFTATRGHDLSYGGWKAAVAANLSFLGLAG